MKQHTTTGTQQARGSALIWARFLYMRSLWRVMPERVGLLQELAAMADAEFWEAVTSDNFPSNPARA